MPLYEYRCTACGYSFEKIQNFSAKPETECPKCHGALIRPVTAPALRFEGAGWYVNDYAGKGAAKSSESSDASEPAASKGAPPESSKAGEAKPASAESGGSPAPAAPAATAASSGTPSSASGS